MGGYLALISSALGGAKSARTTANKSDLLKEKWYMKYPRMWTSFTNPVLHEFNAYQQDDMLADLEAKKRNSTGVAGEAELKKAANSTREIMNQQLQQNIETINQNWGAAGRYGSGSKTAAILQAQNQNSFNLANVVNQMSLQESQFQRNLDEERAWRQASLDAGQPGIADKVGDIASIGIQLYGSNPDYFNQKLGDLGNKVGIGGSSLYATDTVNPTLPDISGMTINDTNRQSGYLHPNAGIMNLLPQRYPVQQRTTIPSFMQAPKMMDANDALNNFLSVPIPVEQKTAIKQELLSTPPDVMIEDENLVPKMSIALESAKLDDIRKLVARYDGSTDWEGFVEEYLNIIGGGVNVRKSVSKTK